MVLRGRRASGGNRQPGPATPPEPAGRGLAALVLAVALAALDATGYGVAARIDAHLFDVQAGLLRLLRAAPAADDVAIVGVDEASLRARQLPLGLLHGDLGAALEALASARPRAIGLDIALPDQSFDALVPGIDRELMRGLLAARAAAALVVALDVGADGRLRIPYAPLLAAAGGPSAFGLPLFPLDCDGRVRRFDPDPGHLADGRPAPCGAGVAPPVRLALRGTPTAAAGARDPVVPTFAARIAQRLDAGRAAVLAQPGYIDFTRGGALHYVPVQDLVAWYRNGEAQRLRAAFGGRVVLLGSFLPYLDRLPLPVALAADESPLTAPPGVIANAQLLRNVLDAGLLHPVTAPLRWAAVALLAALALPARPVARAGLLALALVAVFALGTAAYAAGWFWAPGSAMLAAGAAVIGRAGFDLAAARRERQRLAAAFGGYLSPALVRALLQGGLPGGAARRPIALLFADLRGFTARSEASDPALVRETLNHYYAAITPVLHARGGTIDNFRGDGIMVMFGAPDALAQPCDAAFAAAAELLAQARRLNAGVLAARGIEPVAVTIGLAYGEVVYGELGSADRRDFTALGDAVNVAARLQDVAKRVDFPVVMTAVFARRLAARPPALQDLGEQPISGHTPLPVLGWSPPAGA